jgi:8-oxo-dGTP diphosphatase
MDAGRENVFSLSLKALVLDGQRRCLLLRRSPGSKNNPGKWEFPGGKMEPGEGFEEALKREVKEETNLDISLLRPCGTGMSRLPGRNVVYLFMLAGAEPGEVRLSEEHDLWCWVAPEDVGAMDLAAQFESIAQHLVTIVGNER